MKRNPWRVARLALLGLIVAVGILFVGSGVARGQGGVDFEKETHFRCYIVSEQTPQPATEVTLEDQFLTATVTVDEPLQFCAPTSKNGADILEPEEHLTMYAAAANLTPHKRIFTEDQFGLRTLEAVGARVLLVPTEKIVDGVSLGQPTNLNHYWCYEVNGARVGQKVTLEDQFSGPDSVRVAEPTLFCNPVEEKNGENVLEERAVHQTCYEIKGKQKTEAATFGVINQFETDDFTTTAWELLCVPSAKLGFEDILE